MAPLRATPFFVAALALFVYCLTAYPDLAGGDSGELAAAVATGGVPHPPGYPLYAVLGKVFLAVPGGSVAFRLTLMSAVCDAAAAGLVCAAVLRRTGAALAGLFAGCSFAFAPVVWRYAICAEVFALNDLLVAALIHLSVVYDERAERRYALAFAGAFGLGMANHQTIAFVAGPLALWVLWRGRADLLRPMPISLLVAAFAVGLLPYAYLPFAGHGASSVSWGATDTWNGFVVHVFRREYGTFRLAPEGLSGGASAMSIVEAWLGDVTGGGGWMNAWPLLVGVFGILRYGRESRLSWVLVALPFIAIGPLAVLGNIPVDDPLHRGIVARFFQEPDLVVYVLCGFGIAELSRFVPRRVVSAGAVALSSLPIALHFRAMDHHRSTLVRSYGAEILRAAPPGALLFTRGDLVTNTVRYLQATEQVRPDVRVLDLELLGFSWTQSRVNRLYPDVALPGGRYMPGAEGSYSARELVDANFGRFPILFCGGLKSGDASADATYGRWPYGLCELVHSGTEPVNLDAWVADSDRALPHIDIEGQQHDEGSWEDVVVRDYWEVRQARAAHLLTVAGADPARKRYIAAAAEILRDVTAQNPAAPAHVYKNLAIAIGRNGLDTPEARARAADAWKHYVERAPPGDPEIPSIRSEIRRLEGL